MKNIIVLFVLFIFTGCSTTIGDRITASEFIYPNSNLTPLGQSDVSVSKATVMGIGGFTSKDIDNLIEKAISKYPSGDVLIDFNSDFKITVIPYIPIVFQRLDISGTVVKVEVGKQELSEMKKKLFDSIYDKYKAEYAKSL